jgi:hypothetical protein
MTYDLRRLRSHRYRVTRQGLRTALFFTRVYARLLRPGLAHLSSTAPPGAVPVRAAFDKLEGALDHWIDEAKRAS